MESGACTLSRIALGTLLALASQAVIAYEEDVHEQMTRNAFTQARQNNDFLANLGIQTFEGINGRRTALGWMIYGSRTEDSIPRPLRHFFDPLTGQGLFNFFQAAPDWALNVNDTNPTYSVPGTRQSLYNGLTNTDFIVRPKQVRDAFQGVGQFTHLLQDMAQPQHVRNDDHFSLSHKYFRFPSYSRYEFRTLERVNQLNYGGYPSVTFPSYRGFWTNTDESGLAQQVNKNFVSEGTNLDSGKYSSPLAVLLDEEILPEVRSERGTVIATNVTVQYASYSYTDKFAGPITNNRLSAYSLFDFQRMALTGRHAYSLNNENHDATAALLVPAAVSYSTGLITRFFRGSLAITRPDPGVYSIVDHSTIHQTDAVNGFVGFGTVKLKVRDATQGSEVVGPGNLLAVAKFHRNGCYKDDLSGEFTSGTPPCDNYRTPTEEIVVSNQYTGVTLDKTTPTPFTFTFGQQIPINATDLIITVVYRGPLGNEADEVAVGSVDVFEPSYLAFYNSTDRLLFNGTFIDTAATPVPPELDTNPVDGALDVQYRPTDLELQFGFTDAFQPPPLATIDALPPKRYSRVALLTDRRPYPAPVQTDGDFFFSARVNQFNPEKNQLNWETRSYSVSQLGKTRGVIQWASLIAYKFFGSPDVGDFNTLPDLTNKAPVPLTSLTFTP